jgi:hypothetical protein
LLRYRDAGAQEDVGQAAVIEFSGISVFVIDFMYDGGICNRFFDK